MTRWDSDRWEELEPGVYRRSGDQPTEAAVMDLETEEEEQAEVDATDSAAELAAQLGVDLATVTGSGVDGRITKPDVQAAADAAAE